MVDELSLTELALLTMTNDPLEHRNPQDPVLLTTKEAYIWAAAVAVILENHPDLSVDEDTIAEAYRLALKESEIFNSEDAAVITYDLRYFETQQVRLQRLERLFSVFLSTLGAGQFPPSDLIPEIVHEARRSYKRLVDKGLIDDPVFFPVGGLLFAAIGFVPYSFTSRTTKGGRVYRKMEALFWSYERDGNKMSLQFRLWKILSAFRQALAEEADVEVRRHNSRR
jgi:hypothetical protein